MSTSTPSEPATAAAHAGVVRRAYHALNAADIQALTALFDEHASWHTPGRSPIAGEHRGRAAVFAQFGRYGGETLGTFTAVVNHVMAGDDGCVVGLHHNNGVRNGKRLAVDCCIEFEVRGGKILRGREHFFDLHAWDDFWA
jgi:hypothetical protein